MQTGTVPVNESVAGDRQQFPAVFIVKGSGTVGELHASGQSAQTCRENKEDGHRIKHVAAEPLLKTSAK